MQQWKSVRLKGQGQVCVSCGTPVSGCVGKPASLVGSARAHTHTDI